MLQDEGWTWDFGQGLESTYYLLPGVRKNTGVLGRNMFAGEAQVRSYLSRESGIRDDYGESTRSADAQTNARRTRGKSADAKAAKGRNFVTSTAKGTRLPSVEEDTDDDMSPMEILKKRRNNPPQDLVGDAETQEQYHKV